MHMLGLLVDFKESILIGFIKMPLEHGVCMVESQSGCWVLLHSSLENCSRYIKCSLSDSFPSANDLQPQETIFIHKTLFSLSWIICNSDKTDKRCPNMFLDNYLITVKQIFVLPKCDKYFCFEICRRFCKQWQQKLRHKSRGLTWATR